MKKTLFLASMFDSKKFKGLLPAKVNEICLYISTQGFLLNLVGGSVRDYLLNRGLSHDLDFEIRHGESYQNDEWEGLLEELFIKVNGKFDTDFSLKGMCVFTDSIDGFELEFSSPRMERFINNDFSHKNFTAEFSSNLKFERAWSRRDFTINAIGISFTMDELNSQFEFNLIDPFGGVEDLRSFLLSNVDENFFRDPVRFLRTIRFSLKYNLKISENILKNLKKFNLMKLSSFYFLEEYFKCDDIKFFQYFFKFVRENRIIANDEILSLSSLENSSFKSLFSKEDISLWFCGIDDIDTDTKLNFISYIGASTKKAKRYISFFDLLSERIEACDKSSRLLDTLISWDLEKFIIDSDIRTKILEYKELVDSHELKQKDEIQAMKLDSIKRVWG